MQLRILLQFLHIVEMYKTIVAKEMLDAMIDTNKEITKSTNEFMLQIAVLKGAL